MTERLSMVLELRTPDRPARTGTHGEWLAALRAATETVKRPLLQRIEAMRDLDPQLEVLLQQSPTPILIVRSTREVIERLAAAPEVERSFPEQDAELCIGPG